MDRGLGLRRGIHVPKILVWPITWKNEMNLQEVKFWYKPCQRTISIPGCVRIQLIKCDLNELHEARASFWPSEIFRGGGIWPLIKRHHLHTAAVSTQLTQKRNPSTRKSSAPPVPELSVLVLWSGLLSPSCPSWASCPLLLILWSDSVRFRCTPPFWKKREGKKGI